MSILIWIVYILGMSYLFYCLFQKWFIVREEIHEEVIEFVYLDGERKGETEVALYYSPEEDQYLIIKKEKDQVVDALMGEVGSERVLHVLNGWIGEL